MGKGLIMTLDSIIEKYGMHELDIDLCKKVEDQTIIYVYCHKHEECPQSMTNYYLKLSGRFDVIESDIDDIEDSGIHMAFITKRVEGTYEISGVGGWIHFAVIGQLNICELTDEEYFNQIKQ